MSRPIHVCSLGQFFWAKYGGDSPLEALDSCPTCTTALVKLMARRRKEIALIEAEPDPGTPNVGTATS